MQQEIEASEEEFLEEPALVAPVRSLRSIWSAGVALGRKDKRRPRIEGQPSTEGSEGALSRCPPPPGRRGAEGQSFGWVVGTKSPAKVR